MVAEGRSIGRVSVIMPSLNSSEYIGAAIDSVLAQEGPLLELVIQDGGSTDGTLDIVRSYDDERISLASEADQGQADALNRALARAKGDWLLWLNADDVLTPGAIAGVAAVLQEPYDLVYGNFSTIGPDDAILKRYAGSELRFWRLLAFGCYIFSGTMLVRRTTFDRHGEYDPSLYFAMDYDFLLRIGRSARAVHVDREIAQFRIHGEAKTSRHVWPLLREDLLVRWRHVGRNPIMLACLAMGEVRALAYHGLRPLWQSDRWTSLRPAKRL
jgi:glycosyltransferase involved in cell wall biosynthesis